jgi:hypothetical protein
MHELGIIAMTRAGQCLGHRPLSEMAASLKKAFDAVWEFQEDTRRIHGDCHIFNVLSSLDGCSFVVADLERSMQWKDLTDICQSDDCLPFRLVDIMHLLKQFFSSRQQEHIRHKWERIALHREAWTLFGDKVS